MRLMIVGLSSNGKTISGKSLEDGTAETDGGLSSSGSIAKATEERQDALIEARAIVITNDFEKENRKPLIVNNLIISIKVYNRDVISKKDFAKKNELFF